ncbi:MAG: pirin family protein [Sneathiella sp.]|nr:pirin family protein [Sneathiella sp.]
MLTKRHGGDRGPTNAGWLKSMHTFSFGQFYDPAFMGFGPLRVLNDDMVIPGAGFDTHGHRNMEIISYVFEGNLAHEDSMGTGSHINVGDVQIISAGRGITHSEFNGSKDERVRFLQIWIMPDEENTKPKYQQKSFQSADMKNQFKVVVSRDGEDGSLLIKQDARMLVGKLSNGKSAEFLPTAGRKYWVQMVKGKATVNGHSATAGDGFAIQDEERIIVKGKGGAEVLLFDLPN